MSSRSRSRLDSDPLTLAGSTLALPDRLTPQASRPHSDPEIWLSDLRRLRKAGFAAVDLVDTWLSPAELDRAALLDLRGALAAADLALVGLSVIRKSIIDPEFGDVNLEHTLASIEAATTLGAPLLCIGFHRPLTDAQKKKPFWLVDGPTDPPDEATYSLAVERLAHVCRAAVREGIQISLELYEQTLLGTGAQAAQLVRDVGAVNLGTNPDLGNLFRQPRELPETWEETLQACLPSMNFWHVKNFRRVHTDAGLTSFPEGLGRGDIDYRRALEIAIGGGYHGSICIEHYGGDRLSAQAEGLAYLTALLDDRVEASVRD
jgi:sugar phosphate isomerase/epimerase